MGCSPVPDPVRLSALVTRWRAQRHTLPPATRKVPHADPRRLARAFAALAAPLQSHRERLRGNPWIMAGLGRYEVRNAAVLAQLWDSVPSGRLARRFLQSYLAQLSDPAGQLPTPDQLAEPYRVRTEHCLTDDRSERVDITVEGEDFLLGIEVKIDAGEGREQLGRYREVIRRRAGGMGLSRTAVAFLSPRPPSDPDVVPSTWRDVAAAALAAANASPGSGSADDRAAWLLRCYARHIRDF